MYNIIISKSCYIIKNLDLCEKLYNNTNTFKLNIKFTLSKTIKESNFKAVSYNKITFIEGSKLGLYPSSVNPTNYLYLNNNYVILKQISEKQNLTEDDIKNAEKTYSNSLNIQSVDIQNIMGKTVDVLKLDDSLKRFFKPFIDINNYNQYDDFINKMKFIIDKINKT